MQNPADILAYLKSSIPSITLAEADTFSWRPAANTINYNREELQTNQGVLSLLHEAGHASRGHHAYVYDVELLQMESEAWDEARSMCNKMSICFDMNTAQDSLDTYRDWLYQRSTCITCGFISLQIESGIYRCFNCDSRWRVPHTPICRRSSTKKTS